MEQHAVPQNVTSYQFRLIGDMTVKQFVELAAGILMGWGIISSNLYLIIRWPLGLSVAFIGFALAFLPFEERPLDVFIKNFFMSLFRPTLYIWQRKPIPLPPANHKKKQINDAAVDPAVLQQKLNTYLESIQKKTPVSPLDQFEQKKVSDIIDILYAASHINKPISTAPKTPPPISDTQPEESKPNDPSNAGVRVRKLQSAEEVKKQPVMLRPVPKSRPIIVRTLEETKEKNAPVIQAPPLAPPMTVKSLYPAHKTVKPNYKPGLQMPMTPDLPNLLCGMTADPWQKPIVNAILEIKDNAGETLLVSKSNRLGQFFTATKLNNGQYQLFIEHPDWEFDIINLELKGEIVPPLQIIGHQKGLN